MRTITLRTTPTLTSASNNAVRISFSTSSTSASVSRPLPRIFLMTPSRREDNESNIASRLSAPPCPAFDDSRPLEGRALTNAVRPERLEAQDPHRVRKRQTQSYGALVDGGCAAGVVDAGLTAGSVGAPVATPVPMTATGGSTAGVGAMLGSITGSVVAVLLSGCWMKASSTAITV